jgi:hypothetical protein
VKFAWGSRHWLWRCRPSSGYLVISSCRVEASSRGVFGPRNELRALGCERGADEDQSSETFGGSRHEATHRLTLLCSESEYRMAGLYDNGCLL